MHAVGMIVSAMAVSTPPATARTQHAAGADGVLLSTLGALAALALAFPSSSRRRLTRPAHMSRSRLMRASSVSRSCRAEQVVGDARFSAPEAFSSLGLRELARFGVARLDRGRSVGALSYLVMVAVLTLAPLRASSWPSSRPSCWALLLGGHLAGLALAPGSSRRSLAEPPSSTSIALDDFLPPRARVRGLYFL